MKIVTIERMLGLPIGYLKDEKNLKKPETKALLRIIEVFPWMLNVSDSGFDPKIAKREMAKAAIDQGLLEKKGK